MLVLGRDPRIVPSTHVLCGRMVKAWVLGTSPRMTIADYRVLNG
jgi:hypothetical protein